MKKYFSWKLITIFIFAIVLGFYNLPTTTQNTILPFLDENRTPNKILLGLDLQGGSHLDYKIILPDVTQERKNQVVQGVTEVIERRVNSLGVSQPNIYTTEYEDEVHIIVELAEAGNISQSDVQEFLNLPLSVDQLTEDQVKEITLKKAKEIVGKAIQLEFKLPRQEIDPEEADKIRTQATETLNLILNDNKDFSITGRAEAQVNAGRVFFSASEPVFSGELPEELSSVLNNLEAGQIHNELVESTSGFDRNGNELTYASLIKLISKSEEIRYDKLVETSKIVIAHTELDSADSTITRTKDQAFELAKELRQQAADGADFAALARTNSNDLTKDNNGIVEEPVTSESSHDFTYQEAALALGPGEISEVLETTNGYEIIKATGVKIDVTEPKYVYEAIAYSLQPDEWEATELTGEYLVNASVATEPNSFQPVVQLQFDNKGTELFREITTNNTGKQLAIYVGGEQITAPNIDEPIPNGQAIIRGGFNVEGANILARNLNTGAIPAPIILSNENTVGATIGQTALSQSIQAGLIGLALVMLFMFAYYRKPGLIANLALVIYGITLIFLIKSNFSLNFSLIVALAIFSGMVYYVVNNDDSAWDKFISFILSCIGLYFITFVLSSKIVLDLAGVAGLVLSIGMAVDANILVFERIKEEMKDGTKTLSKGIETGFNRAWTAIRDSNFSTLFTCGILFVFGSNIVKGFAFTLAAGVLVSMFTAITITKNLFRGFYSKKLSTKHNPFGKTKEKKERNYFKAAKPLFTLSSILVVAAVVILFVFNINASIDFTGGSSMELTFADQRPTTEEITQALQNSQEQIVVTPENTEELATPSEEGQPTISAAETIGSDQLVDLSNPQIVQAGDTGVIIKTPYLTPEQFEVVRTNLNETLPTFTVERFNTVGPTLSDNVLKKAILAVIYSIIVIILYVSFAFRKVPRKIKKWRFGAVAIAALVHDVLIVTGVFVLLGHFVNVQVDSLFITALLTVFGYSVNDTIVVLDRLRENLSRKGNQTLEQVANASINQTMARSINTSLSTLITLIAILIWGSSSIFYFVLALTLGTAVGTYSSLFIATPLLVKWNQKTK